MGRTHDSVPEHLVEWLESQPVFFVASAPAGADGHVNVSPKGLDSFRVIDPLTVAYLDLTGSGAETIAHIRDNGRVTLMFCAFDGKPNIVRLFGRGEVIRPAEPEFDDIAARFPPTPGSRSVIRVRLDRIQTSCGYGVPLMTYEGPRDDLLEWAERKGDDNIAAYWTEKNARSIDGLPAIDPPPS